MAPPSNSRTKPAPNCKPSCARSTPQALVFRCRIILRAAEQLNDRHAQALSRATIWRILEDADLKPHQSVYWLNSPDPDFDAKAKAICRLYVNAPQLYRQGRLLLCCDEKTGMQILERLYPTQPAQPGKPEKREFECIRHGTRQLITSVNVPTGEVVWNLGLMRNSADFAQHFLHVADH